MSYGGTKEWGTYERLALIKYFSSQYILGYLGCFNTVSP